MGIAKKLGLTSPDRSKKGGGLAILSQWDLDADKDIDEDGYHNIVDKDYSDNEFRKLSPHFKDGNDIKEEEEALIDEDEESVLNMPPPLSLYQVQHDDDDLSKFVNGVRRKSPRTKTEAKSDDD